MKVVFLFSLIFILTGCNASPLFHHKDSNTIDLDTQKSENKIDSCRFYSEKSEDLKCDLYFEKEKICASIEWKKFQTEEDKGEFYLFFWNPETSTKNGPYSNLKDEKNVFVKLWMPSMGHGSSPVKVESCLNQNNVSVEGVYVAKDVYFIMPGKWEIWIQLKKQKEVIEQVKQEFEF